MMLSHPRMRRLGQKEIPLTEGSPPTVTIWCARYLTSRKPLTGLDPCDPLPPMRVDHPGQRKETLAPECFWATLLGRARSLAWYTWYTWQVNLIFSLIPTSNCLSKPDALALFEAPFCPVDETLP